MDNEMRSRRIPALAGGVILVLGGLLAASLALLGPADGESDSGGAGEEPARVEQIEGSDVARVILSERAGQRLDIQTAATTRRGQGRQLVIPYASLLYDAEGGTWTYTSPEPLVFVRERVTVRRIRGDRVFLSEGPSAGTRVVVVGAAELWGTEFGVGH